MSRLFTPTRLACLLVLPLLLAAPGPSAAAGSPSRPHVVDSMPGRMVKVRAGHSTSRIAPIHASRRSIRGARPTATATIQVTYGPGFTTQAQAAFQAAVNVWASRIRSSQVIHVMANWQPLGSGVLGAAGPTAIFLMSDNKWHPAALAEAACRCEAPGMSYEIQATFNSAFSAWYFGTDGNAPFNQYDLMTVVLHELGHGLGFMGSYYLPSATTGGWGFSAGGPSLPMWYDVNVWDARTGGRRLTDTATYRNPSPALKTQLTDGSVFFGGPHAQSVNGGSRVKLYAPGPWQGGSSVSHLDEATFGNGTVNALMTPFLANGEAIHDPGPLTLAVFRDIGWVTTPDAPDVRIANAARVEGNGGQVVLRLTVTLSAVSNTPVVVRFATANGSAKAPEDYVARSGQITIPAGTKTKVIDIFIKGDRKREPNETFKVNLSRATGGGILDSQAIATIKNDD
jgi:hypothetical protein